MYHPFTLVGANFNTGRGEIEIQFSHAIDPASANLNTLFLYEDGTESPIPFTVTVEQKSVWLKPAEFNSESAILVVRKGIMTIAGDNLPRMIKRRIKRDSLLPELPTIKAPIDFEVVESPYVNVQKEEAYAVEVIVSPDTAFNKVAFKGILTDAGTLRFKLESYGQYYIKARHTKDKAHSRWTEATTFVYEEIARSKEETDNDGPTIIEDLTCIQTPENGITPTSFIFKFDEELDESIGTIKVTRRLV